MSTRSPRQICLLVFGMIIVVGLVVQHRRSNASSSPQRELPGLKVQVDDPLVPPLIIDEPDTTSDPRAHFHPHGEQVCASGCAVSRHPTETLTVDRFKRLAAQLETHGPTADGESAVAFETLLYFGPQTRRMLDRFPNAISEDNRYTLVNHLRTTHARISIRVVDEHGTIRSWIPPTRVPFDRRHVFEMETKNLQPHVASGTVKRVGLDRLWTRL